MGKTGNSVDQKPRCVVIFASEDDQLAAKLASAISLSGYDGWSSHQIAQGKWTRVVEQELETCDAVVPLVTKNTRQKDIFRDEWSFAERLQRPIFPFVVDPNGVPLGFGQYSRTDASGWDGLPRHPCIDSLNERLQLHFNGKGSRLKNLNSKQVRRLEVGRKQLDLPAFVFSLSTFETQIDPIDGLDLLSGLCPSACLVSAYDFHDVLHGSSRDVRRSIAAIEESRSVLFLDSGNYEATRKGDHRTKKNREGWCPEKFWEVASGIPADLIFTYDPPLNGSAGVQSVKNIVDRYILDLEKTGVDASSLCPIVHIPDEYQKRPDSIASLVYETAKELQPTLVAVPERELGEGLCARMRSVQAIRQKLGELGSYQAVHILGTGNPISMAALAACGADSFDGLEWCRTAANYETNSLMHFQQFDSLLSAFAGRMKNESARALAELVGAPFALRVASYNFDYFEEWVQTIQRLTRSGDNELLLKIIPTIGTSLATVLQKKGIK